MVRRERYEDPDFRFVSSIVVIADWSEAFLDRSNAAAHGSARVVDGASVEAEFRLQQGRSGRIRLSEGTRLAYQVHMLCWRDGRIVGFAFDDMTSSARPATCPARG
jgi:hypothetical protein